VNKTIKNDKLAHIGHVVLENVLTLTSRFSF
jgi:hypothetical protein